MFKKTVEILKSEPGQSTAILAVAVLSIWLIGCQSKVKSLNGSNMLVSRSELENELSHILAVAELRFVELNRQDEIKQIIFNSAMLMAKSGAINPIGVLATFGAILGLGATVDNVKKRKKLKELEK